MSTLNNQSHPNRPLPNPNPILNTNPNPSPSPNQNAAAGLKSPSFEEVSKLFTLPLSDAADSLGVCPSVLKKVCYDNGLVRWPYRKFLSGKSIEEIKKDAAVEKKKQLTELKASGEKNVSLASSTVLSPLGLQPQSTKTGSSQGSPNLRMLSQLPTKNNQLESSYIFSSTMNKVNTPVSDEFKYGFPSSGLSSISYRWWGNKSADDNVDSKESAIGDADRNEKQPMDFGAATSSLLVLRTKAAKDGQQALKLGVYRGCGVKTLDRAKKRVLLQVFKSSLADEKGDVSTEI